MKILIAGSSGTLGYGLSHYLKNTKKYEIICHGLTKKRDINFRFLLKKIYL